MTLSPILKKLLFVRQFGIDEGKINLLGDSEIMLNASALLELQEIDSTKLYSLAKKSSFKNLGSFVEHAQVYDKVRDVFIDNIKKLGDKIGETSEGTIKTLQEIFNVYGLGEMYIQDIDNHNKEALVSIKNSTIAEEWVKKYRKHSLMPTCTLTSGIIAGMFSYIFQKEVDCMEGKCKSMNSSYCVFKVA